MCPLMTRVSGQASISTTKTSTSTLEFVLLMVVALAPTVPILRTRKMSYVDRTVRGSV